MNTSHLNTQLYPFTLKLTICSLFMLSAVTCWDRVYYSPKPAWSLTMRIGHGNFKAWMESSASIILFYASVYSVYSVYNLASTVYSVLNLQRPFQTLSQPINLILYRNHGINLCACVKFMCLREYLPVWNLCVHLGKLCMCISEIYVPG